MLSEAVLINPEDLEGSDRDKKQWEKPFVVEFRAGSENAVTLGFVLHLNTGIQPGLQRLTAGTEYAMGIQDLLGGLRQTSHAPTGTISSSCRGNTISPSRPLILSNHRSKELRSS